MGVPTIEIPVWKWNALKKSEADLGFVLATLEQIVELDLFCASMEDKTKTDALFASAREVIRQAKEGE
jgi:hypothetical protein